MDATNFFENIILNTFGGVTAVAPAKLSIALFLSNPTETGTAGTEVSYTGYTRRTITFTEPYAESGGIGVKNTADIFWTVAPNDIGDVRYIGIYDSDVIGSGNMLLYGELTVLLPIKANQQPSLYAGDILFYALGNFSVYFKTKIFNLLRGQNIAGFLPHLALFNGDPEDGGGELTGGNYSRPSIAFSAPAEQPSGQMLTQNTNDVRFQNPTSVWGNWAYDGLRDAVTGGNLILKNVNTSPEIIQKNYVVSVKSGDYKVTIN